MRVHSGTAEKKLYSANSFLASLRRFGHVYACLLKWPSSRLSYVIFAVKRDDFENDPQLKVLW